MDSEQQLLIQVKRIVKNLDPLAEIYLFGSRSQGLSKPDSDWDILILLDQERIGSEVESKIAKPLFDLEIDMGEVISPMIYSREEWHSKYKITPFYRQVMQHARPL